MAHLTLKYYKGGIYGLTYMKKKDIEKLKIEALKKLSIDEKLEILASLMDTIAEMKIEFVKKQYGIKDDKEAIRFLRERMMKLRR